jgi:hypothetical protein
MGEVIDFDSTVEAKEPQVWSCDKCDCVVFYIYCDGGIECGRCGEMFQNNDDLEPFVRKWCRKVEIDKSQSADIISFTGAGKVMPILTNTGDK